MKCSSPALFLPSAQREPSRSFASAHTCSSPHWQPLWLTASQSPWAHFWSLQISCAMILQWKPCGTLFQPHGNNFPLPGRMPWLGAQVPSHERLHKKWWSAMEMSQLPREHLTLNIPQGYSVTCWKICKMLSWKSVPSSSKGNFSQGHRMLSPSSPSSCLKYDVFSFYSKIFSHFLLDFILQFAPLLS